MNNTPYWIMLPGRELDSDAYISGVAKELTLNSIRLNIGRFISYELTDIKLNLGNTPYERVIDALEAGGVNGVVVNSKIKKVFDDIDIKNIQYFHAAIFDENKAVLPGEWYVANIVGLIDCIDKDKSELIYRDDKTKIKFIDNLSFDNKKIMESGLNIFRIESFPPLIVVSEKIRKAIIDNGILGFEFIEPEEFDL